MYGGAASGWSVARGLSGRSARVLSVEELIFVLTSRSTSLAFSSAHSDRSSPPLPYFPDSRRHYKLTFSLFISDRPSTAPLSVSFYGATHVRARSRISNFHHAVLARDHVADPKVRNLVAGPGLRPDPLPDALMQIGHIATAIKLPVCLSVRMTLIYLGHLRWVNYTKNYLSNFADVLNLRSTPIL